MGSPGYSALAHASAWSPNPDTCNAHVSSVPVAVHFCKACCCCVCLRLSIGVAQPPVTGLQGVFCGDCLFMRYGENLDEVMVPGNTWACPVCRGLCNCSNHRHRRGWAPTGSMYRSAIGQGGLLAIRFSSPQGFVSRFGLVHFLSSVMLLAMLGSNGPALLLSIKRAECNPFNSSRCLCRCS